MEGADASGGPQEEQLSDEEASAQYEQHSQHDLADEQNMVAEEQTDGNGRAAISTLFISGFPEKALTRELKNLCRFLPGYVGCNVSNVKGHGSLFAKFNCVGDAEEAMEVLRDVPFDEEHPDHYKLRVSFSRRDLDMSRDQKVFSNRFGLPPGQAPTLNMVVKKGKKRKGDEAGRGPPVASDRRPAKRMRSDERQMRREGGSRSRREEDYGHSKYSRGRGCSRDGDRRSDREHNSHRGRDVRPPWDDGHRTGGCRERDRGERDRGDRGDRSRVDRDGDRSDRRHRESDQKSDGIDTVAVLSMWEKGITEKSLRQWASREPGFLGMLYVQKLDGYFIKYAYPKDAEQALHALNKQECDAEMARRNLDLRD